LAARASTFALAARTVPVNFEQPVARSPSREFRRTMIGQTATAGSMSPPARRGSASSWADRHFKWLMVAPATLLILAFSIYPLLF